MEIHIDFDKIFQTLEHAIRRAYIFSGFSLNAAYDQNFNNYDLSTYSKIQLVPPNAPPEILKEYKEAYINATLNNALRDTIEAFSIFLDKIFGACILLKLQRLPISKLAECEEENEKFSRLKFPQKLCNLKTDFEIFPQNEDFLLSIQKARNCLGHNKGLVKGLSEKNKLQ